MSFKELDIKGEYRSKIDNVATDFYYPILKEAKTYDRAVGFFSSTSLMVIAQGLLPFINNGGMIRIIASPRLSDEDVKAIKEGYKKREKVIEGAILKELYEPRDFAESERLSLLANLIADRRLEIRLAMVGKYGMYHEKMGIFSDKDDNLVAFSGSMNETYTAMSINYESIDVFCSWKNEEERSRVAVKKNAFDLIWNKQDKNVEVLEFSQVEEAIIEKYRKPIQSYEEYNRDYFEESAKKEGGEYEREASIPEGIQLFEYQITAIEKWKEKGYVGIFDMATGTGKTFTGIGALCELYKECNGELASIIVCPLKHLVEQWAEELKLFGIQPIVAYGINKYKDYPIKLRKAIFEQNLGTRKFFCLLCTMDTFVSEKVQEQIKKIRTKTLLLVDEAHNIGAKMYLKYLSQQYIYRLALSATFERHNDGEGTQRLYDYFGNKCIEYSLEQAIKEEKLTKYKYYPVFVNLTHDETEQYRQISKEISLNVMFDSFGNRTLNEKAKRLALKRARLVAGAKNKEDVLVELMKDYAKEKHILVYCGATKSKGDACEEDVKQIDKITKRLAFELGMKVAQFTANENMKRRSTLIEEFSSGEELQALVAIKCLDEGVNVPAIKTAFILASTTNPKEYIQRRGRVLRKFPGKEYAEIYDFVTLPRDPAEVPFITEEERKYDISLVRKELKRVREFQRLADNSYDCLDVIFKIKDMYELYDEEVEEDGYEEY